MHSPTHTCTLTHSHSLPSPIVSSGLALSLPHSLSLPLSLPLSLSFLSLSLSFSFSLSLSLCPSRCLSLAVSPRETQKPPVQIFPLSLGFSEVLCQAGVSSVIPRGTNPDVLHCSVLLPEKMIYWETRVKRNKHETQNAHLTQ